MTGVGVGSWRRELQGMTVPEEEVELVVAKEPQEPLLSTTSIKGAQVQSIKFPL